jgi:hypothetical protein
VKSRRNGTLKGKTTRRRWRTRRRRGRRREEVEGEGGKEEGE